MEPKDLTKSCKHLPPAERFIDEPPGPPHAPRYEKLRLLGDGTFSQVFECREVKTGQSFAIKVVSKSFLFKNNLHEQFTKEIRIHFELDHPNIVRLFRVFETQTHMFLLLELGANGTLSDLIDRRKTLSEIEVRYYLKGVLEGLHYIHKKNILHRDLKPANLILTEKMEIKIADFGLAAYAPKTKRRRKTFCGTPYFIAPEIITKEGHSFEVDFWSLGIIVYNMAYGVCPFQSEVPEKVYEMILKGSFQISKSVSPELNRVITDMLQQDIATRATYESLMESPFLRSGVAVKSLPLSTLETAPSESFISSLYSEHKHRELDRFGQIQRNVYAKSVSKESSGFEDASGAEEDYEYLKKWVNFSDKFGVGGIFNNGIICIFFNDRSKIVLSNFGISFHYIADRAPTDAPPPTYNILQFPKDLEKKVRLLDYFIKFLRQNSHLVRVNESMPDNFVHITNFRLTKYAAFFVLSNGVHQAIFQDGTEVHVYRDKMKRKRVVFIDGTRQRTVLEPGVAPDPAIKKRLEHVNECLKLVNTKPEAD